VERNWHDWRLWRNRHKRGGQSSKLNTQHGEPRPPTE
jgi:hypothetical protein